MMPDSRIQKEFDRLLKSSKRQNWYHKYEVVKGSGVYTPGSVDTSYHAPRLNNLGLSPDFFKGKRVIDIGAATGALTFYLEDLGAEVVAVDVWDPDTNGFNIVHKIRKSKVEHRIASVYDLNPVDFGYFDVVAFFGVFYHLKHPLLAFERVNSILKKGGICIGSGTSSHRWFHNDDESCEQGVDFEKITAERINDSDILNVKSLNELALCGFSPVQFFRDKTNWFIPNRECLNGWLRASGFEVDKIIESSSSINRDWNKKKLTRSALSFNAHKIGEPVDEYSSPNFRPYVIPTYFELMRAKKGE